MNFEILLDLQYAVHKDSGPRKAISILRMAIGCFPSPPLLYRWKGFDEAASFVLRGVLLGRSLLRTMTLACDGGLLQKNVENIVALDEETAAPGAKQFLRVQKSVVFLQDSRLHVKLCLALILSRPPRRYIDELSKLEAARAKLELSRLGIRDPPDPRRHLLPTHDSVAEETARYLCGDACLPLLQSWTELLQSIPDNDLWDPTGTCRVSFKEAATLVLICACESWKRLYHARRRHPFAFFSILRMLPEEAKITLDGWRDHNCDFCLFAPFSRAIFRYYTENGYLACRRALFWYDAVNRFD